MSNGIRCCILGICCPPGSAAQRDALASYLHAAYLEGLEGGTEGSAPTKEHFLPVAEKLLEEFKLRSE